VTTHLRAGGGDWYLLAVGDVIGEVKREAFLRLEREFGIYISDVPDDDLRIDPMQNADRKSDSYRIFIKRETLRGRDPVQNLVDQLVAVGRQVEQADVNLIFRHGGPNPGAGVGEVDALERRLRLRLPDFYKGFLRRCDGWVGFYEATDLFPVSSLGEGPRHERAWSLIEAMDAGSGGALGMGRHSHLPVGASDDNLSIVVVSVGSDDGPILWLTNAGVERFAAFPEFLSAVLRAHRETLAELEEDPWLGAGP
jgi:hypothetical protein